MKGKESLAKTFGFELERNFSKSFLLKKNVGDLTYEINISIDKRRGKDLYPNGILVIKSASIEMVKSELPNLGTILIAHLGNFESLVKASYKIGLNENYLPWFMALNELVSNLPGSTASLMHDLRQEKIGLFKASIFGIFESQSKTIVDAFELAQKHT